ncbi:MAG: hypothetical protein JO199_12855, partial [Candidatus Eremiobacteraeota bacterium]|nr:hypothetical protein [Candidatus Eremiobacteraeota bacterium]
MKRAAIALATFALVAFFAPTLHGRHAAVAATPTPAALQYDEINRVIVPPATPPPPGSFADDFAAVIAGASSGGNQNAPHRGGVGGMLGAIMGGNAPGGPGGGMMSIMGPGHLQRYTYYKGWIRTDDPVAQTATIEKCAEHQYITLNLAAKTYTITNTQPPCPSPMGPMGRPMHGESEHMAPGTVDMTIKSTNQDLGALTIDSIATTGSQGSMEMAMTNATGSCRNADMQMNVMQYTSQIVPPHPYCPLPKSMGNPGEMMSGGGGCKPTMHADVTSANAFEGALGRLVIYRRMSMSGGGEENGHRMAGMNMVMERGNVK